jgi:S-layer protein
VTGFEKLTLTAVGTATVDLAQLGSYSNVTHAAATALTLNNMASGGTLTLTGTATNDVVSVANASTGTADVLNVALSATGALTGGSVTAANVETINLSATDNTASVVAGTNTDILTLVATSAKSIVVTGNAHLTLTNTGNVAVTSIDASGMTGGITVTAAGTVAETIKGGAAANVLTASTGTLADVLIGGAAADTLTNNAGLTTLTGGAGADTFVIDTVGANVNTYTTITDAAKGDIVSLKSMAAEALIGASMTASKVTLSNTAVFQDYANAVIAAGGDSGTNGHIGWFVFNGDTYIVESMHDGSGAGIPSFVNGTDLVVKLTGTIDLTKATFASGAAGADATITLG